MRGINFNALVSSIVTVSRSPRLLDGPLKATSPAPSAPTSTTAISVNTDRPTRQAMRFGVSFAVDTAKRRPLVAFFLPPVGRFTPVCRDAAGTLVRFVESCIVTPLSVLLVELHTHTLYSNIE